MKLAVFTDLDGTLLDHATYSFKPALPAIQKLKANNIPLILASSKTAPELAAIRESLGISEWPAIVENGGGVLPACVLSIEPSEDYPKLRNVLASLTLAKYYRGFGDMSSEEVASATGLSLADATLAKQRTFTEPGVFSGSEQQKAEFLDELQAQKVSARDGGRFLTLSFGHTKAGRLREIAPQLGAQASIALGDAPNDREMLLAADYAVIIHNDHAPDLGDIPGAMKTTEPGPEGWNQAVLTLLEKLLGI